MKLHLYYIRCIIIVSFKPVRNCNRLVNFMIVVLNQWGIERVSKLEQNYYRETLVMNASECGVKQLHTCTSMAFL